MPEDRLTGKGRTIPVRFVVIPAASPDKAPDPVVWFAGGPGDSAVDNISAQPRNWAGAQKVFPDSREITLPGQGHDTTGTWGVCAGVLTQAFIEQASVAHLNTGCLAAAPAPPFDLSLP